MAEKIIPCGGFYIPENVSIGETEDGKPLVEVGGQIKAFGILKGDGNGGVVAAKAVDIPGFNYQTSAPTMANTDGMKVAVLSAEPATKYNGYLYLITEE